MLSDPDGSGVLSLAFALQRNPGAYALLIGAGVSKAAGLPSAWDVQMKLITEMAAARGETTDEPHRWYERTYGQEPRYDEILASLASTRSERQAILRPFFEKSDGDADGSDGLPGQAHQGIAELVAAGRVRIVITLNFDHLIEDAIRAADVPVTVASTPEAIAALNPLHMQSALVVHLHGDYAEPQSLLNTESELSEYGPAVKAFVAQVAREYGLVIAGWSATWDPALVSLIESNPNRFYSSWWIEPASPTPASEQLRLKRGIVSLAGSADSVLGPVPGAADAIAGAGGRDPLTPAVAVAAAKRWLRADTRAIPLHDELEAEFSLLRRNEFVVARRADAQDVSAEAARRLELLDQAVAVPAALTSAAAMWGDSDTDRWWLPEIGRLSTHASGQGSTDLLAIRSYPASVMFHAAAVGAVLGGRWDLLHTLLAKTAAMDPSRNDERTSAAVALSPETTVPSGFKPQARLHALLRSVFVGPMGIGEDRYDEAWEWVAYLSVLQQAADDPHVTEQLGDSVIALVETAWRENPDGLSWGVTASKSERDLADELKNIASFALFGLPHLRTGGYAARHRPRISLGLRRDIGRYHLDHDLMRAGFGGEYLHNLKALVSLVDQKLGDAAIRSERGRSQASFWMDE